ncbi:PREDICTED: protein FAM154A, partial [Eurypyga helias]|uniref:protein FAM154A n=1 Tax=Eurypyga helias TaxID=54383 RepID=UPI0005286958
HHRCPHPRFTPYEDSCQLCNQSEYKEQYSSHPFTLPRSSFKPKEKYKMPQIPMEGISSTKRDYVGYEVLPQKRPPRKHVKSGEPMDLTSTYKKDYISYAVCQVRPCLPRVKKHIPCAKMNTTTTYKGGRWDEGCRSSSRCTLPPLPFLLPSPCSPRMWSDKTGFLLDQWFVQDDYVLWNEPKTELIRPNNKLPPLEGKFNHRTNVQDEYHYRGPVVTQGCKPLNPLQKNKPAFENMTSYRANYVLHPVEKHHVHKCEKYKASKGPFDDLTTYKDSYKGLAGQPAKSAKPCLPKIHHDLPFSSKSEFQENYKGWSQRPVFKKPDVYHPPVEKMDLHTTTQMHYKQHPKNKPVKMCLSLAQLKRSTKPFNASSVMKEDYKPWLCKKLQPITHPPELTFPAKPMDFSTTSQTHYVSHPRIVTKSCKPALSGPKHHTVLDAKTIYNTSYTPKAVVRCLASYKDPPGYVFKGTDADGHYLYAPASKSEHQDGGH